MKCKKQFRLAQSIRAVLAVCAIGYGSALFAHDFWIEPSTFRPAPDNEVSLRLYVGQDFRGEPMIYLPELVARYVAVDADGERPVTAIPGDDPAGVIRARTPGLLAVGYRSAVFTVRFDRADEFERYVQQEGLEHIVGKRPGKQPPVTERYSRAAKTLLSVGQVSPEVADHRLGFTLELVAERNPYHLPAGAELPVRLYYEQRPLSDALVIASNKSKPTEKIRVRTDRDGRARLRLPTAGVWLLTAVHIKPAPAQTKADWESVWASLTFELPRR